jgi:hypothetical protein
VVERFERTHPLRRVRGKYGEPAHWDGLSVLFVLLIRDDRSGVTRSEQEWCDALNREFHVSETR